MRCIGGAVRVVPTTSISKHISHILLASTISLSLSFPLASAARQDTSSDLVITHPVPTAIHITLTPAAPSVCVRVARLHATGLPPSEVLHRHNYVIAITAHRPSYHETTSWTARAVGTTAAAHQPTEDAATHHQHVGAPPVEAPTTPSQMQSLPPTAAPEKAARCPASACGRRHLHFHVGNAAVVRTGARAEAVMVQRM
ncbi:hypothetical protein EI94DRAFT_1698372 [Lactarius quietus]|nr:hypothetical protein EI94DRAFT_1698372 [Lactarius quietus]